MTWASLAADRHYRLFPVEATGGVDPGKPALASCAHPGLRSVPNLERLFLLSPDSNASFLKAQSNLASLKTAHRAHAPAARGEGVGR